MGWEPYRLDEVQGLWLQVGLSQSGASEQLFSDHGMVFRWWNPETIAAHLEERVAAFSPGSNLREDVAAEFRRGFDLQATPYELCYGAKHKDAEGNWVQDTRGVVNLLTGDNADYLAERLVRTEGRAAWNYAAYENYQNAGIETVVLRDGLLANSCEECIARDGTIITVDEIPEWDAEEHPNGSMDFEPVFPDELEGLNTESMPHEEGP